VRRYSGGRSTINYRAGQPRQHLSFDIKPNANIGESMTSITELLGDKAEFLLNCKNPKIPKERLHIPGPDVVDRLYA
jgi:hypothetical protein